MGDQPERRAPEIPRAGTPPVDAYLRRPLNRDRLGAIERFARGSILDVGCGNGSYVIDLGDRYPTLGTDHRMLPTWHHAPGRFTVADALHLPFGDGSFDTVLAFEILEHLADPRAALAEWRRVARRRLLITVPNCEVPRGMRRSNLAYFHYTDRTHVNFFVADSLRDLLQTAGMRVVHLGPINRLSPFPMLAELFGLSPRAGQWVWRLLRPLARRRYYFMTLLAVAEPAP